MRRKLLLPALLFIALCGCCKGHINAENAAPLVGTVTARHDALVMNSSSYTDAQKTRYLRSTAILNQMVQTALDENENETD